MGANLTINIVLSSSLALLWGLLNSLQIVAHFKLLNVVLPSNVKTYFDVMYEISNLSIIPKDDITRFIMIKTGALNIENELEDEISVEMRKL